jgi:hypothetical protein
MRIFTLYFEGIYTPDDYNNFVKNIKQNYTGELEIICYSDRNDLAADTIIDLPNREEYVTPMWSKLEFFDQSFTGAGPVVYFDFDQYFLKDISELINYPVADNEVVAYNRWWIYGKNKVPINTGFVKHIASPTISKLYEVFKQDPEYWGLWSWNQGYTRKGAGQQNVLYHLCQQLGIKLNWVPGDWHVPIEMNRLRHIAIDLTYQYRFNYNKMEDLHGPHEAIKSLHFVGKNKVGQGPRGMMQWFKKRLNGE